MSTPLHEKVFPDEEKHKLPKAFIMRRLHSLLGLWLVIYLFEHLLVNSQAALYLHDNGYGFVTMVNKIHELPYLPLVEIIFLAIPFLIHGAWGILYLRTAKANSFKTDGHTPSLPQYRRNRAYSWQRITSWILVVGIIAHVIHMRFVDAPILHHKGDQKIYITKLHFEPSLYGVIDKLNGRLYNRQGIDEEKSILEKQQERLYGLSQELKFGNVDTEAEYYNLKEQIDENESWIKDVEQKGLKPHEVIAITPNAGSAFLLILRDAFKNPMIVILYSILVITASYHAFNGLWTFFISWGINLTRRSQSAFRKFCQGLIILVTFMGLAAAWGTYFIVTLQN